MKKFYTVLMAAAAIVSANAAQKLEMSSALDMRADHTNGITKVEVAPTMMLVPTKETKDDLGGIEGEYTWSYYSYLNSNSGAHSETITITLKNPIRQTYTIDFNGWEVEATFNAMSNTLTIAANQDLGYNEANAIQVYFYHRIWNADGQGSTESADPFEVTYADGVFTFGEDDIIAIGNSSLGWFYYADSNRFTAGAAVWEDLTMPAEGWEPLGTGTFVEGWQIPAYGQNAADYPYDVQVEKNTIEDGAFRIVSPYGSACPIYQYNSDQEAIGYIAFNISDPEFVGVYPGNYCGLTDEQGAYLPTNLEGYYMYGAGYTKEEIIEGAGLTSFSNYDAEANLVTFINLVFGTKDTPNGRYIWKDQSGNAIHGEGSLKINLLGAIDGVAIDSSIAPVEYYNLQGMRVMNPDNGIYIKKQGDKAIKVRVVR